MRRRSGPFSALDDHNGGHSLGETVEKAPLQFCGPNTLDRVDSVPDHTLSSIRAAPAAAVVARIQPAATRVPAIHRDAPSSRQYPSCPRFTIGSRVSVAKNQGFQTGFWSVSIGTGSCSTNQPLPSAHRPIDQHTASQGRYP